MGCPNLEVGRIGNFSMSTSLVAAPRLANQLRAFRFVSHCRHVPKAANVTNLWRPICCRAKVLKSTSNTDIVVAMSTSLVLAHRSANQLRAIRFVSRCLHVPKSANVTNFWRPICCSARVLKSTSNADTVVAIDESYGRKEVISVNPRIYGYLLANVREPEILRELREETAKMQGSQMQVSPDQAQLLAMLVEILGAERCIEVGVYTGYSSLAVALVLPEGGQLVACERDGRSLEVAQRYYNRAGVSNKVKVKHGLAADTLKSMVQNGEGNSYDFAFVDAEKRMYQDYFELLLQLVRVGGLIVIDNVLWHGRVADPLVNDAKTLSIRNFNRRLMEDNRVSISMVPIGDGMTICRKR